MDTLIADLKDVVEEAKSSKPGEDGTIVVLYGLEQLCAVGPNLVRELATSFTDVLYGRDAGFDVVVCRPCRPR